MIKFYHLGDISLQSKKEGLFWLNLVTSVSYLFCIIKYSGDPLPDLHISKYLIQSTALMGIPFRKSGLEFTFQTVITRLSRTLVNVMGECFANETVKWHGKVWNWGNQNGSKLLIFSCSTGALLEIHNTLPNSIKLSSSISAFKHSLQCHFFWGSCIRERGSVLYLGMVTEISNLL